MATSKNIQILKRHRLDGKKHGTNGPALRQKNP